MNQNFNTKTVRSAVRVALFNKDNYIYLNGSRSKVRYMLTYQEGTLYLVAEDGDTVITYFVINAIPQKARVLDKLIKETADIIISKLTNKNVELEHYVAA